MRWYGYTSDMLPPRSGKPVVGMCELCGVRNIVKKHNYIPICSSCSKKQKRVRAANCNWKGGTSTGKYCHKFNECCRERNRNKYGRTCFICGKTEAQNGRNLDVHHVDMNKGQGCDGYKWKLVPLCHTCHPSSHTNLWRARIEYLLWSVWV